jgi:hypothetical protein
MDTYSPEQLGEFLDLWRRSDGAVSPDQLRALVAWSGTPDADRESMQAHLDALPQLTPAAERARVRAQGVLSGSVPDPPSNLLERVRRIFSR